MRRISPSDGAETTMVLDRDSRRAHGEVRELADSRLDIGATLSIDLARGEGAVLFCLDGRLQVTPGEDPAVAGVGFDDTVFVPPADGPRELRLSAQAPSRVLHGVVGSGYGLRFRDEAAPAG